MFGPRSVTSGMFGKSTVMQPSRRLSPYLKSYSSSAMTTKAKVAALRTRADRVLDDYDRLFELAGVKHYLQPAADTILKDNISWHFPFPAANTTPWQLEGTIRSLTAHGYNRLSC